MPNKPMQPARPKRPAADRQRRWPGTRSPMTDGGLARTPVRLRVAWGIPGSIVCVVAGLAAGAGLAESVWLGAAPGFALGAFWREIAEVLINF